MFTVILSDDEYTTSDASEAFDIYSRGARAGDHPCIFRDDKIIVRATECRECGEVVLMTYADTQAWLAAFGDDLDSVLCEACIDEMLAQENAVVEAALEWEREVEIMLFNAGHVEQ